MTTYFKIHRNPYTVPLLFKREATPAEVLQEFPDAEILGGA